MTDRRQYRVKGVDNLTLLLHKCLDCDHLNVLGFWHQLSPEYDLPNRHACLRVKCKSCGKFARKHYRLTSGRAFRKRLIDWMNIAWALLPYLPVRLRPQLVNATFWLERRVRL